MQQPVPERPLRPRAFGRFLIEAAAIEVGIEQRMAEPPLGSAMAQVVVVAIGEPAGVQRLVRQIGIAAAVLLFIEQPMPRPGPMLAAAIGVYVSSRRIS